MRNTIAFIVLSPWIDVGRAGTLALNAIEAKFGVAEAAKLATPGTFYDFTRYRPVINIVEGERRVRIPNTLINYSIRETDSDLLFVHCLEPHSNGEIFIRSLQEVFHTFDVKQYCMVGAMYDSVPHTRPLTITGSSSHKEREAEMEQLGVKRSSYQGPTTILVLLSENLPGAGIESSILLAHLPNYAQMEEDYTGAYTVLNLLNELYDLAVDLEPVRGIGEQLYKKLDQAVAGNPQAKEIVTELERSYDAEAGEKRMSELPHTLSPEVEKFLKDIGKQFGSR